MADNGSAANPDTDGWPEIDTSVPHITRVYDYLLGGKANFAVDREAAEHAYAAFPGGLDGVRTDVRAHRAMLGRIVRYLAGERGIRQFLDIGTGVPSQNNVHEVAQSVAPESRIVYVDYDPIVLAHAHHLLASTPDGECAYIFGDLRDPQPILRRAAQTLDLSQPAALLLFGVLHCVTDAENPYGIVSQLVSALAPGSFLALSHLGGDLHDEVKETFGRLNRKLDQAPALLNQSITLRNQAEVARFLDGLDLVDPGVVRLPDWRPDPGSGPAQAASPSAAWCAVGYKR